MICTAYLAMSLDGFIAGPNNDLAWLDVLAPPADNDMGFGALMDSIDALVMGRTTFEVVTSFDIEWPYTKPVIVMSKSLTELPAGLTNVELTALDPAELVAELEAKGMSKLYIDGGRVVSSFLRADLLDELIATVIPVALGDGTPLFSDVANPQWFDHVSSEVFDNGMVQNTYHTQRNR